MKTFFTSKLIYVLSIGMLSVLFTADSVQAAARCCCCGPATCEPYVPPGFPPVCPSGCTEINQCMTGNNCQVWCDIHIYRPDEDPIIESFMDDEYIAEVIAMDEECTDEENEVAEE